MWGGPVRTEPAPPPPADAPPDLAAGERRTQIDGLRVIAMCGVVAAHVWLEEPLFENVRVPLFFTISGFVITAALLRARDRGGRILVVNFYARRALRLVPPLLILLAAGVLLHLPGVRETLPWHLLQLTDVLIAREHAFEPASLAHLWSLNVLEQFYLIWPPVVLWLSLRRIRALTVALLLAVAALRNLAPLWGFDWAGVVLAGDPIAAGALTCLLLREERARRLILSRAALGLALLALLTPLAFGRPWGASEGYRLLATPALAVLVAGAWQGWRGPVGAALASRPMIALARISYGVYVYHLAVADELDRIWPGLGVPGPLAFTVVLAASVALAALSWVLVERPLGRLRHYLPTAVPARPPASGPARETP